MASGELETSVSGPAGALPQRNHRKQALRLVADLDDTERRPGALIAELRRLADEAEGL
jgi:hypothetical protein